MAEPQGKHVCCWEREKPHRCILCCQCGKKFGGMMPKLEWRQRIKELESALQAISDIAVGHGDVCELIARRARTVLSLSTAVDDSLNHETQLGTSDRGKELAQYTDFRGTEAIAGGNDWPNAEFENGDKMAGMRNDPKRCEMMRKMIADAPDLPCEVGDKAKTKYFLGVDIPPEAAVLGSYQDGIRAALVHIEECLAGRVEPTNPTMQMLLDWRKAENLTADKVRFIMFKSGNWNPKGNLNRYRTENTMAEFDFEAICTDLKKEMA